MDKKKQLNGLEVFGYGIGGTIGSGLFVLMPFAVGDTGRALPICAILAVFLMVFAYFYNIVISSMFPLKGGDYSHVAFLVSPTLMGVYALMTITTNLGIAALATSALSYSSAVIPGIAPIAKPLAFLLLTFFFLVNSRGAKFASKIEGAMSAILIISLLMFVVLGLPKVNWSTFFSSEGFMLNGITGFFAAIAMMSFASQGPCAIGAAMAAETRNPTKTIPRVILLTALSIAVIYSLMAFVATGALPIEQVAYRDLTVVSKEVFPYWFFVIFVFGGAVAALLTSVLSQITTARYPLVQMAKEGWLPPIFKKETKSGYPYVIMVTLYIITMIPLIFNISFDIIVSYVCVPMTLYLIFVNMACIKLPKKYPEQWKNSILHMPYPLFVVLMVFCTGCCIFATYTFAVDMGIRDIITLVIVCIVFYVYSRWCLKSKRVDINYLNAQKEAVAQEILDYINTEKTS